MRLFETNEKEAIDSQGQGSTQTQARTHTCSSKVGQPGKSRQRRGTLELTEKKIKPERGDQEVNAHKTNPMKKLKKKLKKHG